uniref:Uncharacterized protein n=1 Tax=Arundo donax TaxID=35708 RepID=A0A0A9DN51_ARUDO
MMEFGRPTRRHETMRHNIADYLKNSNSKKRDKSNSRLSKE